MQHKISEQIEISNAKFTEVRNSFYKCNANFPEVNKTHIMSKDSLIFTNIDINIINNPIEPFEYHLTDLLIDLALLGNTIGEYKVNIIIPILIKDRHDKVYGLFLKLTNVVVMPERSLTLYEFRPVNNYFSVEDKGIYRFA